MQNSTPIQLAGKTFDLRFDFAALLALEQKQGINVFNPDTFRNASPSLVAKVLWAGMLHQRPDLELKDVVPLLDVQNLTETNTVLMTALGAAIGGGPDAKA